MTHTTPPRLGEPAIPFRMRTTMGDRSLDEYRGRWLFLFSHPADFTPVCTSEFIALAGAFDRFQALGCDLLGLSVDSLFSHLAWLLSIQRDFGVTIPFPVGEDLSMAIASAYGMVLPTDTNTSGVRSTFLIDPQGIVRAASQYPMTNGRNVEETLRLLAAMQETDATGLSTPAGWQPGDPGIEPAPTTLHDAIAPQRGGAPGTWYYRPAPLARVSG